MSGKTNSAVDKQPRALFTHCYKHSLNFAVGDTVKNCKTMKVALHNHEYCFADGIKQVEV